MAGVEVIIRCPLTIPYEQVDAIDVAGFQAVDFSVSRAIRLFSSYTYLIVSPFDSLLHPQALAVVAVGYGVVALSGLLMSWLNPS